jgi:hypothetical protein
MSLCPRADLDVAGEGFTATCNDEEALNLVEDSCQHHYPGYRGPSVTAQNP